MKPRLLIGASEFPKQDFDLLKDDFELFWLHEMHSDSMGRILPTIDCLFVLHWPKVLDHEKLETMTSLSMVQTGLAGVNHIPFRDMAEKVIVCSNAGAYSVEVGEFAFALLLDATKRISRLDSMLKAQKREGDTQGLAKISSAELGRDLPILRGKKLGILGYGGIGRQVANYGRAFDMEILSFSRAAPSEPDVRSFSGETGLVRMLPLCDALVISLPLTKLTHNLIGERELSLMKTGAVLVNVARAEIVDEEAIYRHLSRHNEFVYATDVWWRRDGKESFAPPLPFQDLTNFLGTPHVSGPSALKRGSLLREAIENLLRYKRGERPRNSVERNEYV